MLKRILSTSMCTLILALVIPAIANAHVLKVEGDIGAVLHINPDDNPATGDNTDYIMYFDDDTGKFSLPKCNCTVSIIENGRTLATKPLAVSSNEVSENHYTFTKPDVYDLRFIGQPKTSGAFKSFQLDYAVRVTNGQISAQPIPITLWIGMGMAISLLLLAAYAQNYDTNRLNTEKE